MRALHGMLFNRCHFLTLVRRDDLRLDPNIRRDVWHSILTRLRQDWPQAQAWDVIEYGQKRGIHLHAIITGADTLTQNWVDHIVALLDDGTTGHLVVVEPGTEDRVAAYLTKGLRNLPMALSWPRGFRLVSATRGWDFKTAPRQTMN